MAFSGDILSLDEVEECIFNKVLIERPVECWLSSRANVARFGDIFEHRAVAIAEYLMRRKGVQRQEALLKNNNIHNNDNNNNNNNRDSDNRCHHYHQEQMEHLFYQI